MNSQNKVIPIVTTEHATCTATVTQDGHQLLVQLDNQQTITATKAFSCFIEPVAGDTVLLSFDEHNQAFVIAVLKREHSQKEATLNMPANTTLQCEEDLTLHSGRKTSMVSQELVQSSEKHTLATQETTVRFERAAISGGTLHNSINAITVVSDMIQTLARQAIQKFSLYTRKTEQSDQIHAGQMNRRVDGLYSMDSKHTILVSKKETKIDGEHIHMG